MANTEAGQSKEVIQIIIILSAIVFNDLLSLQDQNDLFEK